MRRYVGRKAILSAIAATLLVALMPYFYQTAVHVHRVGATQEQKASGNDSDQCLLCHFHTDSAVEAVPTLSLVVLTSYVQLSTPSVPSYTTVTTENASLRAPPILLA